VHCGVDSEVDVTVGEDEHGVLAAQLERELRKARRHRGGDRGAGLRASGEGDRPHALVGAQRGPCLLAGAMHDVEDAARQAGSLEEPGEHRRAGGRELRRLGHDSVAHGERRRQLPREQVERQVPRRHEAHHAHGLAHRVVERVIHARALSTAAVSQLATRAMLDQPSKESQVGHCAWHVHRCGQSHRLARVSRLCRGEGAALGLEESGGPPQDAGSLRRARCRPLAALECTRRGGDGGRNIGGGGGGHGAARLAARLIDERQAGAASRVAQHAVHMAADVVEAILGARSAGDGGLRAQAAPAAGGRGEGPMGRGEGARR